MQLKELNKAAVQPAGRPVRILQFGEGNFLRAFVDWQIDIANEKGVTDAGVAVVPAGASAPDRPSSACRPRTGCTFPG